MSRVIASSLEKMPTTSVRRLISPLRRSNGLMEWILILREAHEGEDIGLRLVHERGELRHFRTELIGDLAPLLARGLGVVLNESGANEGGDHATALAAGMGEHVAHEVHSAALP
jgi:hypothetical protein